MVCTCHQKDGKSANLLTCIACKEVPIASPIMRNQDYLDHSFLISLDDLNIV